MHGKMRKKVEEGDRLSRLPDDLIHKILSFIDIREAIETGVLSSRWRFLWTSMPYLDFSTEDFSTLANFTKFVMNVLSRRNNLTEVYSLKLCYRGTAIQISLKNILDYAFSHNIQQLNVVCLLDKDIELPLSFFSSQSLKHFSLTMQLRRNNLNPVVNSCFTSTWDLPALTTLDLHYVTLCNDEAGKCIDFFSKCVNLKSLTLKEFNTMGSKPLSICHPRLLNLTLENSYFAVNVIKVDAPHLKNLIIRLCYAKFVISACDLASLRYRGSIPLHLSTDGIHSVEKAVICVSDPETADARQLVKFVCFNNFTV